MLFENSAKREYFAWVFQIEPFAIYKSFSGLVYKASNINLMERDSVWKSVEIGRLQNPREIAVNDISVWADIQTELYRSKICFGLYKLKRSFNFHAIMGYIFENLRNRMTPARHNGSYRISGWMILVWIILVRFKRACTIVLRVIIRCCIRQKRCTVMNQLKQCRKICVSF